jgi:3-hydroxy-9,10-secoandrosta-1,3,5(10)-triene-9,17-dione monooxygenase
MVETQLGNGNPVQLAAELPPLRAMPCERNANGASPLRTLTPCKQPILFKVMVPRRWGGYGAPLRTTMSTFAEIAKGCSSSGWVTMIIGGVSWWASLLPDRGQEEIFANSADARVCAALPPNAVGQRADGGLRISGRFPFASGCWHSTWGGLGVQIEDDAHNVVSQALAFAPISELEIEDTWFVAGMCGTGSNTLVAKDIFVPDHRVLPMSKIISGEYPARRHSGEPSDTYTFTAANSLVTVSTVIGIAQAMLDKVIEGARTRGISFTTYTRQADAPVVQHEIAKAALKIDSAWLQLMHAAAEVEETAAAGKQMGYVARARARGIAGFAAKLIREAIDALASIGGASGFADSSPLQRMWRDASIATRHGIITTDPGLEIYGRALLRVEGNITPFI